MVLVKPLIVSGLPNRILFDDYEQIVRHKSGPLLGLPIAMVLALLIFLMRMYCRYYRVHRRLELPTNWPTPL